MARGALSLYRLSHLQFVLHLFRGFVSFSLHQGRLNSPPRIWAFAYKTAELIYLVYRLFRADFERCPKQLCWIRLTGLKNQSAPDNSNAHSQTVFFAIQSDSKPC